MADESLIPQHGGYRNLKSFQVAQLAYDLTVLFCEKFIDKRSRTNDQMVQAARSGVQNIAEGSQASGTSKKMEVKLTNVARASLEELRLDYQDYLRHRRLPEWPPNHPALMRFKQRRCQTLDEVRAWVAAEYKAGQNTDGQGQTPTNKATPESVPVPVSPCPSVSPPNKTPKGPTLDTLAANAALSLLNLACYLLDRQIAAQAAVFLEEGGFTERLYRIRSQHRRNPPKK